jgi:hypothetical protein
MNGRKTLENQVKGYPATQRNLIESFQNLLKWIKWTVFLQIFLKNLNSLLSNKVEKFQKRGLSIGF